MADILSVLIASIASRYKINGLIMGSMDSFITPQFLQNNVYQSFNTILHYNIVRVIMQSKIKIEKDKD